MSYSEFDVVKSRTITEPAARFWIKSVERLKQCGCDMFLSQPRQDTQQLVTSIGLHVI